MKAFKERTNGSLPPVANRQSKTSRSEAIRKRARAILNDMPKELKELADELSKF